MDKDGVMMILEPKNNWIEVDLSFDKKEEKESLIALPEDYKPAEKPYKAVSMKRDPLGDYKYGDVLIVPSHIIREIDVVGQQFYLIERSHIMAVVEPE
jgi:co-chaperonin GroES (HSP10)